MKKRIMLILGMILCLCFCACSGRENSEALSQETPQTNSSENETVSAETQAAKNAERKLKLTINGQEIGVTLYDTPAANALYNMLPLELTFEDYNGIEKISYLSEKLSTEGEPEGCNPAVGDLCLYAPWGNLSIFYKDFRYSNSLVLLGHIDGTDIDAIGGIEGDFSARLEVKE